MKLVYIGANQSPSFFVVKSDTNIKGFSKTVEVGDILITDPMMSNGGWKVEGLTKRDYNGKFLNKEDAKNNFFDAQVRRLKPEESADIRNNHKELFTNIYI